MGKNKELIAIATGFLLIIVIVAFTFLRPTIFPEKKNAPAPVEKTAPKYEIVSAETALQKITKKEDVRIIDTRTFEEYAFEHILDSLHIPLEQVGTYEEKSGSSVILLTGENREETALNEAASLLLGKGASKVMLLETSWESWKIAGGQTVSYGDPTSFTDQSKVSYVSPEDLKAKIEQGASLFILDVREKTSFEKGRLPGASNIPLPEIEKRRSEIPASKQVIIYADKEIEAFQASVRLYDTRLITSAILKEGCSKWTSNNFPIEQ